MNRKEIDKMWNRAMKQAVEAGEMYTRYHFADLIAAERDRFWQAHIEPQVEIEVAAEREACAKVCEDIDVEYEGEDVLATWCAAAIRARGQE